MSIADKPLVPSNFIKIETGITLREFYAGLAMQGLLASHTRWSYSTKKSIAQSAIEHADQLIKELEKTDGKSNQTIS